MGGAEGRVISLFRSPPPALPHQGGGINCSDFLKVES